MPTHDYQYFTIDSVTGVIRTTQIFDREIAEQAHLLIDVKATDKGSPQRSDTTFVDIEVIDDNDMAPVFETTDYSLEVEEDVPLGEVLYFFTVKDNDVALNSIVNFFISEGNQDQAFEVITKFKPNGGELIVEDKLDFEATKTYRLKIIATDGRSASQTANVNIKVRNIFLFKQLKGEQYVVALSLVVLQARFLLRAVITENEYEEFLNPSYSQTNKVSDGKGFIRNIILKKQTFRVRPLS